MSKEKQKTGNGFGVLGGCSGCLGLPVLLFGLYYAFGHPSCIDAPCTDTGPVGGTTIFFGALLVWASISAFRAMNRIKAWPRPSSTPKQDDAE